MKKILSANQTRDADKFTIENEPISSIDLMERASRAFIEKFQELDLSKGKVQVVCGIGNNGGDGLAISRLLIDSGVQVEVVLLKFSENISKDCQINWDRIAKNVLDIDPSNYQVENTAIIIDAIFGSGLNRPVEGALAKVIDRINSFEGMVVSVDIPSGLFADEPNTTGAIVEADHTITFQMPKLSFLLPESGHNTGQFHVVDIGLNESFIEGVDSDFYYQSDSVFQCLPKRNKFQHKGDFGRVQLIAGSLGKLGAAHLCATAMMKSGVGLLTIHVPKCGMIPLQTNLPEAMLSLDDHEEHLTSIISEPKTDIFCLGPGLGTHKDSAKALRAFFEGKPNRVLLDADGLNIISQHSDIFDLLPEGTVITPHVGEFHRLFGSCENGKQRIQVAQKAAFDRKLIIVLKGAHTAIILPNKEVVFNNTGNPGMATGGSGDVLAGIITSFMAQGLSAAEAALLGVHIHGIAGDLSKESVGELSLMASDLLINLPKAICNV